MQFHLNGFRAGDPELLPPAAGREAGEGPKTLPEQADVLIVGCGPTGLALACQLSGFPDIETCIVERKDGPLELGQADGIACRSMEMFNAFGFAERVLKEAYWVNELTFWKPKDDNTREIVRSSSVRDTEEGLSEFPHVILNQARVHEFFLDTMRKSPTRLTPHYSWQIASVDIDQEAAKDEEAYPVTVTLERPDGHGEPETRQVRARYVVGCDGARSKVRQEIGLSLKGDSINQAWGVMDVLALTDFPDMRKKSVINSSEGSIVLIPREGGYLVRIYVEMGKLKENERISARKIVLEDIIGAAQRIFSPYALNVKEVAWWSIYEIGQRLCPHFDNIGDGQTGLPRVFIAGDACHTHSPKAGQGMNVSMQDAFNLGWKLAAVLRGQCAPELLHSYSTERQSIAHELISFDRKWATLLSMPVKSENDPDGEGVEASEIEKYFVQHGHYTAGTATVYSPSAITGEPEHQPLAKGFRIGARFHSAPVIRLADARPVQLGHTVEADGRWRLFVFAGMNDSGEPGSPVAALCDFLTSSPTSPIVRYTPKDADVDSVIDVRAIFQRHFRELDPMDMPGLLLPQKGKYGLRDYQKVFVTDQSGGRDIYEMRGIDREKGCVAIIRPDQHVAHILPVDAHDALSAFFDGFMINKSGQKATKKAMDLAK